MDLLSQQMSKLNIKLKKRLYCQGVWITCQELLSDSDGTGTISFIQIFIEYSQVLSAIEVRRCELFPLFAADLILE